MVKKEDKINSWIEINKVKIENSILVEGLPGIGNVGKIATDFIIEQMKAKKIAEFYSYDLPHSVFIRENNLVELPKLELYLLKKGKDVKDNLLFLTGDVQPNDERSCYEFCDELLDFVEKYGCTEVITTGGIGLPRVPKNPQVYCTANEKDIVKKYKKLAKINDKTHGIVGPVVGVTGLLLGLAGKRNIPAISLLTETFAHPMYLGMASARNLLEVMNKIFNLKLNLDNLDQEIANIESEVMLKTQQIKQLKDLKSKEKEEELKYIG
jgi:uncharacterized protein